ncbi:MAG: sigma-70 family RNA polymerase sigma factor [Acidimicrobiales bacterium]
MTEQGTTALLVAAAGAGEAGAWDALVQQFGRLVWSVTRDHGLSQADAADVSQTTWLRLAEHLRRLRDPDRVGVWLATTARNESLRLLRRSRREELADPGSQRLDCEAGAGADVDRGVLDAERDAGLWQAFESLSSSCKVLLRILIADPSPTYAEVSAVLGMAVGSIGPTRNRCIDRLRRRSEFKVSPKGARATSDVRATSDRRGVG